MTYDPFRSSNLARAARANADPVYLTTGRFAPPNSCAIWLLPTPAHNVVRLVAYQESREVTCAIVPPTSEKVVA